MVTFYRATKIKNQQIIQIHHAPTPPILLSLPNFSS
jgi:hypothetical protein